MGEREIENCKFLFMFQVIFLFAYSQKQSKRIVTVGFFREQHNTARENVDVAVVVVVCCGFSIMRIACIEFVSFHFAGSSYFLFLLLCLDGFFIIPRQFYQLCSISRFSPAHGNGFVIELSMFNSEDGSSPSSSFESGMS